MQFSENWLRTMVDPKMTSIYPFSGARGNTFTATVRGSGLAGTTAAILEDAPLKVVLENVASEPPPENAGRNRGSTDLVTLRIDIADDAKPGLYPIRLVTRHGLTTALSVHVVDLRVVAEPAGAAADAPATLRADAQP